LDYKEIQVESIPLEEAVLSANTGADAIKKAPIVEENTGLKCLRIGDVSNNKSFKDWGFTRAIDSVKEKFLLREGDIIIARTGNTIGVVKYINKNLPSLYNNGLIRLKIDRHNFDPLFIYYNLKTSNFRGFVYSISGGTSTQPNMKINHTLKYEILKVPLTEQKAIAYILSTLDEKIETNNKINEKLEEMTHALFKRWFIDYEFPNENGEPYKSSGGKMVESELGVIPEGWRIEFLNALVGISNKSVKPHENPNKVYEHYSIPAYDNNKEPEYQDGKDIKSNKYNIDGEIVLVSKLNPSTKRIWKPVTQSNDAICSTEFMVYVPKIEKSLPYVYEFLNSDQFQNQLISNATGSTGSRQRVKPKETLQYKVMLPPQNLILNYSEVITSMHQKIDENIVENKKLRNLRDNLLPKLLSGAIRVPLDNNILGEQVNS